MALGDILKQPDSAQEPAIFGNHGPQNGSHGSDFPASNRPIVSDVVAWLPLHDILDRSQHPGILDFPEDVETEQLLSRSPHNLREGVVEVSDDPVGVAMHDAERGMIEYRSIPFFTLPQRFLRQGAFDDFQSQLLVQPGQFGRPRLNHGSEVIAMLFQFIFRLHFFGDICQKSG